MLRGMLMLLFFATPYFAVARPLLMSLPLFSLAIIA